MVTLLAAVRRSLLAITRHSRSRNPSGEVVKSEPPKREPSGETSAAALPILPARG
jgi:hypothetical protein